MCKTRFSVEQIVAVPKQADLGLPMAELTYGAASRSRVARRVSEPALVRNHHRCQEADIGLAPKIQ